MSHMTYINRMLLGPKHDYIIIIIISMWEPFGLPIGIINNQSSTILQYAYEWR